MMKTTTTIKKSVVKPTAPIKYDTSSSNETDDEDEQVQIRT